MKIQIKNVGRIALADINIRNLTMFIGKNDSGKTYAASTIWALINYVRNAASWEDQGETNTFKGFFDNIKSGFKKREHSFETTIKSEQINHIQNEIGDNINNNLSEILSAAIGYDGFGESTVSISPIAHINDITMQIVRIGKKIKPPLNRRLKELSAFYSTELSLIHCKIMYGDETVYDSTFVDTQTDEIINYILTSITSLIAGISLFGIQWTTWRNAIYIPAARTGIILALDYYRDARIRGSEMALPNALPAPIQDFASEIASPFLREVNPNIEAASDLLNGRITRARHRTGFNYTPNGTELELPLSAASSLVTELAALSLVSDRLDPGAFVILEEPEAHLHLDAQRQMAKYIALAVNRGVKMLITTHSDTFLQQVNNLIALSDSPEANRLRKKFDVSREQTISRDSISAYDFICDQGTTITKPLEMSRFGFIAESLNNVLLRLAEETMEINDSFGKDK